MARLAIGLLGRRGILLQELHALFEMGPPFGVVPHSVAGALAPYALGRQCLLGVQERLVVQGNCRDIPRRGRAAPLHLPPLLWGAPEVAGLLRTPEGLALHIPEALLAVGFPQSYKAPSEGVPHRYGVAQHFLGRHIKRSTEGSILRAGEGRLGVFEGGARFAGRALRR